MLRRLTLARLSSSSAELEVELDAGFTVLTGETGAGKSILIDALQLALGSRGDAGVVREGAARAEVSAEFDTPPALAGWLDEAGFDSGERHAAAAPHASTPRARAAPGSTAARPPWRSCARPAEQLVDIHGQHAWQSLTRPAAVRALLDA